MSSSKNAKRYRVRNQNLKILGTFTQSEIQAKIKAGKFEKNFELAAGPDYTRWQKLGAIPAFFDLFLRKIHGAEADSDESSDELAQEAVSGVVKARLPGDQNEATQQKGTHVDPSDDFEGDLPKTAQIAADKAKGKDIDPELIEELFTDVDSSMPSSHTRVRSTQVQIRKRSDSSEPKTHLSASVAQPPPKKKLSPERKRLYLWVGLLAGLLYFLFQSGEESAQPPVAGQDQEVSAEVAKQKKEAQLKAQVANLVREGDQLFEADIQLFYQRAMETYREILSLTESDSQVMGRFAEAAAMHLSNSLDANRLVQTILESIKSGRATDPHNAAFYRAEARVAIYQRDFEKAVLLTSNALESDPTSPRGVILQGEIDYRLDELAQATESLELAVRGDSDKIRSRYQLAVVKFDLKDYVRASELANEILKMNPFHAKAYVMLADIARVQNKIADAIKYYEAGAKLSRFTSRRRAAEIHFRLARLLEISGREADSVKHYLISYYYNPNITPELKEKLKDLDTSPENLNAIVENSVYGVPYFERQAQLWLGKNKYQEALLFLRASYILNPRDASVLYRMGEIVEKRADYSRDFQKAMNFYRRAIAKDPRLSKAYIQLGLLETEQYNLDKGYQLLSQALALDPQNAEPYIALGKHFFQRRDCETARDWFLKANELRPNDSESLYYAGLLMRCLEGDAPRKAMVLFNGAYIADPTNYEALAEWLKLKVVTNEVNFAKKFVRSLQDADPENPELFWVMGEVYEQNGEKRRAVDFYKRALDRESRSSRFRMSLGRALEGTQQLGQAIAEYRNASLMDRRKPEGFFRAAVLLYRSRRYQQSEEILKYLIELTPKFPGAHKYLSRIYVIRKNKELAIEEMKTELKYHPQDPKNRTELAEVLMRYERHKEAVGVLAKVTNLKEPQYVLDKLRAYLLLSRCYRALNRYESALGSIELALGTDPDDPQLMRELGFVYVGLQRDKEAAESFRRYLDRNPAARDASEIRKLIRKLVLEN